MKHVPTPSLRTPAARLGAYGVILAAALGGGAVVGAAVGPEPSDPPAHDEHAAVATPPGGSSATSDGYHLQLDTPVVDAGRPATLQFVVHDPDGDVLTDYDVDARPRSSTSSSSAATCAATPTSTRPATTPARGPSRCRRSPPVRTGCTPTSCPPAARA